MNNFKCPHCGHACEYQSSPTTASEAAAIGIPVAGGGALLAAAIAMIMAGGAPVFVIGGIAIKFGLKPLGKLVNGVTKEVQNIAEDMLKKKTWECSNQSCKKVWKYEV